MFNNHLPMNHLQAFRIKYPYPLAKRYTHYSPVLLISTSWLPDFLIYSLSPYALCTYTHYTCRVIITFVKSALQNHLILTNKPNFKKVKLNVTKEMKKDYEKMDTWWNRKKQSQTKPNKANFQKAKMNVTVFYTKEYEEMSNWAICENKPNSNPIRTQTNPISKAKNAPAYDDLRTA